MKKLLTITLLILSALFFAACVEDDDNEEMTDTISGDTQPSGDTTPSDPSDTSSSDTGDTGSSDTGSADTGSADTGSADTGSADTGDTGSADTGSADTGSADTGDTGDTGDTTPTPVECTGFSIAPDSFHYTYDGIYRADITEVLGSDSIKDELVIEFRLEEDPQVKTYNLTFDQSDTSTYHNRNYQDCDQCVSVFQDVKSDGSPTKQFFQESGSLTVEDMDSSHGIKGSFTAKLVEIKIASDGASEPVANGACFEIESLIFDNLCVPDCEGKVCGSDGCGGTCGDYDGGCPGENEGCSADQTECVTYECEQVTLNDISFAGTKSQLNIDKFFYSSSFKKGDSSDDINYFWLRITGLSMIKETDLTTMKFLENCKGTTSQGDITPGFPESDSVCFYIEDKSDSNRFYFPNQGTINITDITKVSDNKANISATLSGIRLVETDTITGIAVAGGKCLEITNETLSYTAE